LPVPSEERTPKSNLKPLAEGTICPFSINLIRTDNFGVVTISVPIGLYVGLQIFSFVVGNVAQQIKKRESITRDRNLP
jgi:hypothetical protein